MVTDKHHIVVAITSSEKAPPGLRYRKALQNNVLDVVKFKAKQMLGIYTKWIRQKEYWEWIFVGNDKNI